MNKISICIFAITITLLSACKSTPQYAKSSPNLELNASTISAYKNNISGLYDLWIRPHTHSDGYKRNYVQFANKKDLDAAKLVVQRVFTQFCSVSGGSVSSKKLKYGKKMNCFSPHQYFLGSIEIKEYVKAVLEVIRNTPEYRAEKKERVENFIASTKRSTPTGILTTYDGEYEFVRIGELNHPLKLSFSHSTNGKSEKVSFDKVSRLTDLEDGNLTYRAQLIDGTSINFNLGQFNERLNLNYYSDFGYWGVPFVIKKSNGNLAVKYVRRIKKIEFNHGRMFHGNPIPMTSKTIITDYAGNNIFCSYSQNENLKSKYSRTEIYEMLDQNGCLAYLASSKSKSESLPVQQALLMRYLASRVTKYWDAYTSKNFRESVLYIAPKQLQELKDHQLPLFLEIYKDRNLTTAWEPYFELFQSENYAFLSKEQTYLALSNLVESDPNKQNTNRLRYLTRQVTDVSMLSEDSAKVKFVWIENGNKIEDFEILTKFQGEWYLTLKSSPEDMAMKLRKLYGRYI
jgi:hypothetical protein